MKTSVALCTYNGEIFLRQQIDSILNQNLPVSEIVVCDDGSTDGTIEILEDYRKRNPEIFRIYRNDANLRSVKNFEKAISLCENEIIFLSDQDDVWLPEKVEAYCSYFQEHPETEVIASNGFGIDDEGNLLDAYSVWDLPGFFKEKNMPVNYFKMIAYCGNIVTGATIGMRKSFVPETLPFPVVKDFYHDEWIGLIAASRNKLHFFDERYFKYRIHENQQVGGIFTDKTEKHKQRLIDASDLTIFDSNSLQIDYRKKDFIYYKGMIKRTALASKKYNILALHSVKYKELLQSTASEAVVLHNELRKGAQKKYPFSYKLLNITDAISGKRKL